MPTEPALKLHSTRDPEPDALGDLDLYAAERVQLTLSGAAQTVEVQETPLPGTESAGLRPASGVTQLFGRDERDLPEGRPEGPPDRMPLWPVAAALMVGIALGFGGGYTLGGRGVGPASAAAVIAPPGREWTEGAVNDTSSRGGAAAQPEPAATVNPGIAGTQSVTVELKRPAAIAPAAARPPAPPRPATPDTFTEAALSVDSRPGGARVFIDGKLVGTTPISVLQVGAGAHAIRLERDGYRRWSSSIRMVAGERNRVTASLDK